MGESAAPKALNPETHYVRLEELAIYQDQIVAGAVGTEELSDASVRASPGAHVHTAPAAEHILHLARSG